MEYFSLWYVILLFSYFLILFGYMYFSYKPDTLNNILGFITLLSVFFHISLFLLLMNHADELKTSHVPLFTLSLAIPLFVVGMLILISTGLPFLFKGNIKEKFIKLGNKMEEKLEIWSKAKKDTLRKLNHVLLFIFLVIFWNIGLFIVIDYAGSSSGMIPEGNNMLLLYARLLNDPDSIVEVIFSFGWFYYLLFFLFYIFFLFALANEFTRKSKHFSFLFNIFPKLYLTHEEKQSYGTYLYFAIGQLFAALICPPMVFLAILGISAISDLVTSQIGIRYGKIHISWNDNKTWEGTVAGIIVSFWICLLFVGILWSFIFTIIFLICDLFTSKPIKISDNLLIPIACSLTYIAIRFFFNFNYSSIITGWI